MIVCEIVESVVHVSDRDGRVNNVGRSVSSTIRDSRTGWQHLWYGEKTNKRQSHDGKLRFPGQHPCL